MLPYQKHGIHEEAKDNLYALVGVGWGGVVQLGEATDLQDLGV